jgi:hypothetical protein
MATTPQTRYARTQAIHAEPSAEARKAWREAEERHRENSHVTSADYLEMLVSVIQLHHRPRVQRNALAGGCTLYSVPATAWRR